MTRVVIVDEHDALRQGLTALLGGHGFDVVGDAAGLAAGSELIERTEPDVALVDADLADGSGIDLARQVLTGRPGLGVILYAAHSDPDLLQQALDCGARGFVLKQGSMPELVGAIERIAAGGSYVDPRVTSGMARQVPQLSPRDLEIMRLMAEGRTVDEIATGLDEPADTIRWHVRSVMHKLGRPNA
jgi:DNA-binding NarL/FixJ family response regulator